MTPVVGRWYQDMEIDGDVVYRCSSLEPGELPYELARADVFVYYPFTLDDFRLGGEGDYIIDEDVEVTDPALVVRLNLLYHQFIQANNGDKHGDNLPA